MEREEEETRKKIRYQIILTIIMFFAVVAVWRGIWGLLDLYLFPDNPTLSFIISILIGLFILIISGKSVEKFM